MDKKLLNVVKFDNASDIWQQNMFFFVLARGVLQIKNKLLQQCRI